MSIRSATRLARAALLAAAALMVAVAPACKRGDGAPAPASSGAAAPADALPPLVLRDDTPKLLLTWVDEKGDFHVVQKVADVPEAGRSAVRAVVADREAGTGALVYVADLRAKKADGSYPVKTMTRAEWDEMGASRRKSRLEELAGPADAAPPGSASAGPQARAPHGAAAKAGSIVAIIYGAEWCGPCHEAARYLRQRGVSVVEKDIEESDAARAEMRAKLERAKMPPTASIPIIDVMGRIMVGFSAAQLDRAVAAARSSQTL